MHIIWDNNPRYWKRIPDEPAFPTVFPTVAVLFHVFWFDVRGSIRGVPRGKYVPTWRVRVLPRSQSGLNRVRFSTSVRLLGSDTPLVRDEDDNGEAPLLERKDGVTLQAALESVMIPRGDPPRSTLPVGYQLLRLPVLDVGDWEGAPPYLDVTFEAVDHSGSHKDGLFIDCFELVPVGEEETQRIRDRETALAAVANANGDGGGQNLASQVLGSVRVPALSRRP
ncbi:hypothetical protein HKX48_008676 [Thoreauomyces humboldtii]|nr:hypothetical protein HKX48_008676 [Thoreauomyces humboldtii]